MLDIVIEELKAVAMDFYKVTGVMIALYDENRNHLFSYPDASCDFCRMVRTNEELARKCIDCDNRGFDVCAKTGKPYIYRCHMNLAETAAPIYENNILIGYMMLGQVVIDGEEDAVSQKARETAARYNLDRVCLLRAVTGISVMSGSTINSAARMMSMCACYLYVNRIIKAKGDVLGYQLNEYIDKHLSEKLSVTELCRKLYISRSKLYSISTQTFGMGISDYIRSRRIAIAKEQLSNSQKSVEQIAYDTGFRDANYFIRIFKQAEGITPLKYRRKSQ